METCGASEEVHRVCYRCKTDPLHLRSRRRSKEIYERNRPEQVPAAVTASVRLSTCLSASVCFAFPVYLRQSTVVCLSVPLIRFLSLSLSLSHSLTLSHSFSLSLPVPLSKCVCMSLCRAVCLSHSLSLSLPVPLAVS